MEARNIDEIPLDFACLWLSSVIPEKFEGTGIRGSHSFLHRTTIMWVHNIVMVGNTEVEYERSREQNSKFRPGYPSLMPHTCLAFLTAGHRSRSVVQLAERDAVGVMRAQRLGDR